MTKQVLAVLAVTLAAPAGAQTTAPTGGTVPTAAVADVATVDGIIAALYGVISGPAGQARDWDSFRSLFVPEAKLIPTGFPEGSVKGRARFLSVEDYVTGSGPSLQEVIQRGINSIQLTWDGERWWIANIMWRGVGPSVELPARYLRGR
ncbi:MAG: hypothetical protein HYW52_07755 [Gemmatimonadetes bacterium]|nr:hypothetical protein [Gemmatimonadota bacterium]